MRPVGRGDIGKRVVDVQTRLAALGYFLGREGADGFRSPRPRTPCVVSSSSVCFLPTEWSIRIPGPSSSRPDFSWENVLYLRVPPMRGDDVLYLQKRLGEFGFDSGPADGIFSSAAEVAVTEFQRNAGLNVDGIVGETTLDRLRPPQEHIVLMSTWSASLTA